MPRVEIKAPKLPAEEIQLIYDKDGFYWLEKLRKHYPRVCISKTFIGAEFIGFTSVNDVIYALLEIKEASDLEPAIVYKHNLAFELSELD